LLTQAARQTNQLSEVLYKMVAQVSPGADQRNKYFSAELNLVDAQLNERLALVQLYHR